MQGLRLEATPLARVVKQITNDSVRGKCSKGLAAVTVAPTHATEPERWRPAPRRC